MPRKLFTAPTAQFLAGDNARPLRWIFGTLNEYFRTHIGYWDDLTGTTDANGRCVFTHNCGFEPHSVFVTELYVSGAPHDMGPFHIHSYDSETIDVHFLTKSGQDRSSHDVHICFQLLPITER
jgi:hypothetical protein